MRHLFIASRNCKTINNRSSPDLLDVADRPVNPALYVDWNGFAQLVVVLLQAKEDLDEGLFVPAGAADLGVGAILL